MNTTELMIGDLVVYKDRVIRVENVHHDKINYYPDIPYVQEEDYIEEKDIVPIQLTPEILEKNGFVKCSTPSKGTQAHLIYDYLEKPNEGIRGHFFIGINCIDCGIEFVTDYVHELQHALRLCGLNDLADNFKV